MYNPWSGLKSRRYAVSCAFDTTAYRIVFIGILIRLLVLEEKANAAFKQVKMNHDSVFARIKK